MALFISRINLLVFLFLCCAGAFAADLNGIENEDLRFRAEYVGIFSAGQRIPVADVRWTTTPLSQNGNKTYLQTELIATSQAYDFVESIYPFRYRIRSWYKPDASDCLAYESYEQNTKTKHSLVLLPGKTQKIEKIEQSSHEFNQLLQHLELGSYSSELTTHVGQPDLQALLLDRMSLMQSIRGSKLKAGMSLNFEVATDKQPMRYVVKVEKADNITLNGVHWPAWKIRFNGIKKDDRGRDKQAHRALFIWLSRDERQVPLRAVSRHSFGRIEVELVEPSGPKLHLTKIEHIEDESSDILDIEM